MGLRGIASRSLPWYFMGVSIFLTLFLRNFTVKPKTSFSKKHLINHWRTSEEICHLNWETDTVLTLKTSMKDIFCKELRSTLYLTASLMYLYTVMSSLQTSQPVNILLLKVYHWFIHNKWCLGDNSVDICHTQDKLQVY